MEGTVAFELQPSLDFEMDFCFTHSHRLPWTKIRCFEDCQYDGHL